MIFVFGSNLAGRHGKGAALEAHHTYGAVYGVGVGRTGAAYAIPTKDADLHTLPIPVIAEHVHAFIAYAASNPTLQFTVTRIGCGLAGYTDADIAPMFVHAPPNCQLPPGWRKPAPSYAGIGSRQTPEDVLALMQHVARALAGHGWILRSGGADGADTAFALGAAQGPSEIYLPWPRFNRVEGGIDASALPHAPQAATIARQFHPAWERLRPSVRKLMGRNAHQILGEHLDDPVTMVVCWATGAVMDEERVVDVDGGTGLAVRLAAARRIPVFNLALPEHRTRIGTWLDTVSKGGLTHSEERLL